MFFNCLSCLCVSVSHFTYTKHFVLIIITTTITSHMFRSAVFSLFFPLGFTFIYFFSAYTYTHKHTYVRQTYSRECLYSRWSNMFRHFYSKSSATICSLSIYESMNKEILYYSSSIFIIIFIREGIEKFKNLTRIQKFWEWHLNWSWYLTLIL